MSPRYLDVPEAAAYLGDTEHRLRHKVQRREIPFIKDGHRLKFDVRDLDAYMHARKIPADSATSISGQRVW